MEGRGKWGGERGKGDGIGGMGRGEMAEGRGEGRGEGKGGGGRRCPVGAQSGNAPMRYHSQREQRWRGTQQTPLSCGPPSRPLPTTSSLCPPLSRRVATPASPCLPESCTRQMSTSVEV